MIPYAGDRGDLAALFALADDSPDSIAAYRALGTLLVAKDGGKIVGLALVVAVDRSRAELKSLAVDPPHQHRGIGARLVEAAAAGAKADGAALLEVATASADIGNLRFYQRAGFRMVRIERDAFTPATGYPAEVVIDGILLRDCVVFDRQL